MAGAPGYTVDEARADAREWIKGTTLHGGSRGWRVCCAILDERIAELEAALGLIASCEKRCDGDVVDIARRALGTQ